MSGASSDCALNVSNIMTPLSMAAQSITLVFYYVTDTFLLAALYESIHRISSFHMEESFFWAYVAELVMQPPLSVQK